MRVAFVCLALAACGFPKPQDVGSSDDAPPAGSDAGIKDAPADAPPDAPGPCDVFAQTGCGANQRCTYVNQGSALGVMCEPMGTAGNGSSCTINQTSGLDDCVAGDVCAGTCKTACSPQGSNGCGSGYTCNSYQHGNGTVGACDRQCDPLDDNDFDGPGTAHTKTGTVCTTMQGCYGAPAGTSPTSFSCAGDLHYSIPLHHRTQCDQTTGCTDASNTIYLNSCNQGYEPLLVDQTGSTQAICVAFCKPANCSQNNCGGGNVNQLGVVPHRCNTIDAVGSFNTGTNGEECTFFWYLEGGTTAFVRSPFSDTLGFCFDHSKYKYDSNNDGMLDLGDAFMPPCSTLPTGTGTATAPHAADFGCEDTAHAGLPSHAPRWRPLDLRLPYHRAP